MVSYYRDKKILITGGPSGIGKIEKNKRYVSIAWSVPFVRMSQGLLPAGIYDWFVGEVLGCTGVCTILREEGNKLKILWKK